MLSESTPGFHTSASAKTIPAVPSQYLQYTSAGFLITAVYQGTRPYLSVYAAHLY